MQISNTQSSWVNILSKGLITIPKKMREKVGIKEGDVAKITLQDNKIIIESKPLVSYRFFTDEDVASWMKEDELTPTQAKKIEKEIEELWPDMP